jgi:hypothetical protein
MQLLTQHGIDRIFHFAPLHYLPFIGRAQRLKSKPVLASEGFLSNHFRSTSAHIDEARGFGNYVHLSTVATPPILAAKLESGFPHIGIELRTSDYPHTQYDLCRFNIAKTRYLRRDGKPGFSEGAANGQYYGSLQIPIARSAQEKDSLLRSRDRDPMVEVLIDQQLPLSGTVVVRAYCDVDQSIAENALNEIGVEWEVELHAAPSTYARSPAYADKVCDFIQAALSDPNWRGNGLEFDRV